MDASGSATALAGEVARAALRPGAVRTLLLDLDGTLAGIEATPRKVRVPHATLCALRALVGRGWLVAIVSGRPALDVRRVVRLPGLLVFGSHGAESGSGIRPRVGWLQRTRLRALSERARRLARDVPGAQVEEKPAGLAIHDRNVAARDLGAWRRSVRALLASSDLAGLEVLSGHRLTEVRVRGHHKGRVVRQLVPECRPARCDASLVAIGDDRTDEDLFAAVQPRGLAVRVGPPGVRTRAIRRLPSPGAVSRFLCALAASPAAPGRGRTG